MLWQIMVHAADKLGLAPPPRVGWFPDLLSFFLKKKRFLNYCLLQIIIAIISYKDVWTAFCSVCFNYGFK
jgi:hypothetical protein